MKQFSKTDQILINVAIQARRQFPNVPIRIWYVMLSPTAWKAIVINTSTKIKLVEGPVKKTMYFALNSFKNQLEKVNLAKASEK